MLSQVVAGCGVKGSDIMTVIVEGGEISDNAKQSEAKDRVPHGVDYTHTVSGLLDD